MPSSPDSKIDELYQEPLSNFTAARNALAKSVGGDEAKRIRALEKPTLVPWAINQVYWRARAAYDRLMKSGERLRTAQIAALEGRSADIRAASEAHRHAIAEAVAEAERLSASAGSKPGADALARTFEALSLTTARPESPGRLTQPLQPAGFEALVGVKPQPGAVSAKPGPTRAFQVHEGGRPDKAAPQGKSSPAAEPKPDAKAERARREAEAREAAALRERQAALKQAEAKLARAEAAEKLARAAWEKSHDELLDARRTLATLKSPI